VGLALVLTSLGIGYQLGTLNNSNPPSIDIPEPKGTAEKAEDEKVDEDDEELEDISDGDLGSISAGFLEPCKLVRLIIRGIYDLLVL
jgi:PTH2 family peptidyl-tRNA hydrolase